MDLFWITEVMIEQADRYDPGHFASGDSEDGFQGKSMPPTVQRHWFELTPIFMGLFLFMLKVSSPEGNLFWTRQDVQT